MIVAAGMCNERSLPAQWSRIGAAVLRANGKEGRDCGHAYHQQPDLTENDRVRLTIYDVAGAEKLRRVALLNGERYDPEQPAAKPRAAKSRAKGVCARQDSLALVDALATTSKHQSRRSCEDFK